MRGYDMLLCSYTLLSPLILSLTRILLRLHFAELHIRADLEVLRLLLAVADQLLLPDLTDRLAGEIARGVAVGGVPAGVSLA